MVRLGQLALDGTKVRANASRRKAMSYAWMTTREKALAEEVSAMLYDAEAVDKAEDAPTAHGRDDDLLLDLRRTTDRLAKISQAKAALEAEAPLRRASTPPTSLAVRAPTRTPSPNAPPPRPRPTRRCPNRKHSATSPTPTHGS